MESVHAHEVYEIEFESKKKWSNPLDHECLVNFTSPSGKQYQIEAFWDGGNTWRCRFCPTEKGEWYWQLSPQARNMWNLQEGSFWCERSRKRHLWEKHGDLTVHPSGRFLMWEDGTPFFWLADTAWNGVLRGDDNDWKKYLTIRRDQGFSVIQFVASQWRGEPGENEAIGKSFSETSPVQIYPEFFQQIDKRVAMVNRYGLIAAPVILWSLLPTDPGYKFPTQDCIRIARYITARYGAYKVVWILGGDGNYQEMGVQKWKEIGQKVFLRGVGHQRLVTLHPCGVNWVGEEFREEAWYHFIGYQSGHGDGINDLTWLVKGPPFQNLNIQPNKPVINLEPNYEGALGYHNKEIFTAYHVRRAAYWSLLVSPTAGLTYGHDYIWNWNSHVGPSVGHGDWNLFCIYPWKTVLETEGITSIQRLRKLFSEVAWWNLVPYPQVLLTQPGDEHIKRFIASSIDSENRIILLYTPMPQPIQLSLEHSSVKSFWYDPRQGKWHKATLSGTERVIPPGPQDWVLWLEWKKKSKKTNK